MSVKAFVAWLAAAVVAASSSLGAATGWYLLQPILFETPITDEQMSRQFVHWREFDKLMQRDLMALASLDRNAPLGRWTHKGSFDLAAACEQFRQKLIEFAKSQEIELRTKYPDGMPTLLTHMADESRCIASDDPRLASR